MQCAKYVFSIFVRGFDATAAASGGGGFFFLHSPQPPPCNSQNPANSNDYKSLIDEVVKRIT